MRCETQEAITSLRVFDISSFHFVFLLLKSSAHINCTSEVLRVLCHKVMLSITIFTNCCQWFRKWIRERYPNGFPNGYVKEKLVKNFAKYLKIYSIFKNTLELVSSPSSGKPHFTVV